MESSSTASVVCTFFYMPPEQWQGITVDHRADIYSLGITLYQMLTGHLSISNELESVVRRALAKDRDDSFENMGEMADAIRDALARPSGTSAAADL
jgi:serine/threonine protein kinase